MTPTADVLASAFFTRQILQLNRVPFRPLASTIQPADRDGIRTLTRIDENDPSEVKYLAGYYSPRAWVMVSTGSWKNGIASYDRYGIDLIAAEGRNQVLRARNPGSAAGYRQEQEQRYRTDPSDGRRLEERIRGLPDSVCASRIVALKGDPNRVFACYVSRGRYAASAQGSSLAQAQQGATASYVVLERGK